MPERHEIRCVNKSDRPNPHERITHVGGVNPDGSRWKLTQQVAVHGWEQHWDGHPFPRKSQKVFESSPALRSASCSDRVSR